jgi:uncharacterized protein (DUF736 family)
VPEYDNDLRGALFKNKKKETDKHPDYQGNCEISGVEFWISAWLKKSKDGETYMSLAFQGKEDKPAKKSSKKSRDDMDDVPF